MKREDVKIFPGVALLCYSVLDVLGQGKPSFSSVCWCIGFLLAGIALLIGRQRPLFAYSFTIALFGGAMLFPVEVLITLMRSGEIQSDWLLTWAFRFCVAAFLFAFSLNTISHRPKAFQLFLRYSPTVLAAFIVLIEFYMHIHSDELFEGAAVILLLGRVFCVFGVWFTERWLHKTAQEKRAAGQEESQRCRR